MFNVLIMGKMLGRLGGGCSARVLLVIDMLIYTFPRAAVSFSRL